MSKKRTKKQKQTAKHDFTISWQPTTSEAKSGLHVNRQFPSEANSSNLNLNNKKNSVNSVQTEDIAKTRKNIIKSLILAGIILGTEVVLYFFWK